MSRASLDCSVSRNLRIFLALDTGNDHLEPQGAPSEEDSEANDILLITESNPQDKSNGYGDVVQNLKSAGVGDLIGIIGVDSNDSLKFARALDDFANRKGSLF